MKHQVLKHLQLIFILSFSILSACAKYNSVQTQAPKNQPIQVNEVLVPTHTPPSEQTETTDGYEPLPTEIKTKSGTLQLGLTQFSDIIYNYHLQKKTLLVTGKLKILSTDKSIQTELDFTLEGEHLNNESVIVLSQKNHAQGAPVLRAKATCLNSDDNENYICDKAIVDFFIFYKKQFYTDQFETQNVLDAPEPISFLPDTVEIAETTTEDEDQLQAEGKEDSRYSRYQGQVHNVDLDTFLTPEEPLPEVTQHDIENSEPIATAPPKAPTQQPDIKQSPDGALRLYNQAIGYPDHGSLRNATSIKDIFNLQKQNSPFVIANLGGEKFYGTHEMSKLILNIGHFLANNYDQFKLLVGNISVKKGGLIRPHLSHQIGMDVDLAYPAKLMRQNEKISFPVVVPKSVRKLNAEAYSTEKTFALLKQAFKQTEAPVDRVFIDRLIIQDLCKYAVQKNEFTGADKDVVKSMFESLDHVDGHGDHFHVRLKCTDSQPACRTKQYKKNQGCNQTLEKN